MLLRLMRKQYFLYFSLKCYINVYVAIKHKMQFCEGSVVPVIIYNSMLVNSSSFISSFFKYMSQVGDS